MIFKLSNTYFYMIRDKKQEFCNKEATMKLSVKEGAIASVMTGMGDSFVSPFALALKANNAQIGLLSSIPGIIAPLSQIFGSRIMEKYSRRKIMFVFAFLQAMMWIPILSLSFLLPYSFSKILPILLVLFYSIYAVFGAIGGPSWFSLLGEIIPSEKRGKYFSKRNKICTEVFVASTLIGAFLLDYFKTKGWIMAGFSILFFVSAISRTISSFLLRKHCDLKFNYDKDYYFSFFQFAKKSYQNNFGKFVIFLGLFYVAATIAGPFFSVYMLKDLNFSYTTFILINISASVFSAIFFPFIGKLSDKYGNRELLRFSGILIALLPILWVFSKSPWYIILVPQLLSGIGWATFNLAVTNFIYDAVTPQRRGLCVSYMNIIVGIGVFIGSNIGGVAAYYLPSGIINKFLLLFIISGLLRFVTIFIMMPRIKEVRKTKKPRSDFFYLKEILNPPIKSLTSEISRQYYFLKSKIIH